MNMKYLMKNSVLFLLLVYNRLVELNVAEQCVNVLKIPNVQKAMADNDLEIHGWVFDIESGRLIDFTEGIMKEFHAQASAAREIYRIRPQGISE